MARRAKKKRRLQKKSGLRLAVGSGRGIKTR
jgi:hypothetical protein